MLNSALVFYKIILFVLAHCVLLPYIPSTLLLLVKEVLDDPWPLFVNIAICKYVRSGY